MKTTRPPWLRLGLGVAVSLVTLGLAWRWAGGNAFWPALRQVPPQALVVAAALLSLSLFLRALAWRVLLDQALPTLPLFWALNIGYLLNNLLPFRAGEVGRTWVVARRADRSFWQVASTVMTERAFDLLWVALLTLGTLPFVVAVDGLAQTATLLAGVVLLAFVGLYLAARYRAPLLRALARGFGLSPRGLTGPDPAAWAAPSGPGAPSEDGPDPTFRQRLGWAVLPRAAAFLEGLAPITRPGAFLAAAGLLALSWGVQVLEYGWLLRAFVPGAPWVWAAFGLGVVALGVVVPSSPGFVGVVEAAIVGAMRLVGVDPAIGLAYALAAHGVYFAVTVSLGVLGLLLYGESLGGLYRRVVGAAGPLGGE